MSLGKILKGWGAQVAFSFGLPVGDSGKRRQMGQVNAWLRGWCHAQGFGFCDIGCIFEGLGVLMLDGAQLSRWGKSVVGSKLAELRACE